MLTTVNLKFNLKGGAKTKMKTKFLVGGRGSGITTALIREASENDYVIITSNHANRNFIQHQCEILGINCPRVVTVGEVTENKCRGLCLDRVEKVVIDNADTVLHFLLSSYGVYASIATIGASIE